MSKTLRTLAPVLAHISHRQLLRRGMSGMSGPGLRQRHRSDPHRARSTAAVGLAPLPCQDTMRPPGGIEGGRHSGTSRRCL